MKFNLFKKLISKGTVKQNNKIDLIDQTVHTAKINFSHNNRSPKNSGNQLTPDRIAEIRERINKNFYDQEDVLKVVAKRILHSPELQELIKTGRLDKSI